MMDTNSLKRNRSKGITLIELLIALVISSVVMAALYRTAISQQKAYIIQDEVIDMQQNLRNALSRMAREIRMAGYGFCKPPANIVDINGANSSQIINAVNGANNDSITIVMADEVAKLSQNAATGTNQIQLDVTGVFDNDKKKYLCINGLNNYLVQTVNGNLVTLTANLSEDHVINESIHLLKAITFSITPNTTNLVRNENTGDGDQILADNIEGLQLQYTLSNGTVVNSPGTPSDVREVNITITGRTSMPDPQYSGDGYRRQTVSSNVDLRNMGL